MIVCSCTGATLDGVTQAAQALHAAGSDRAVTSAQVFRELGFRPACASCKPLIGRIIAAEGNPSQVAHTLRSLPPRAFRMPEDFIEGVRRPAPTSVPAFVPGEVRVQVACTANPDVAALGILKGSGASRGYPSIDRIARVLVTEITPGPDGISSGLPGGASFRASAGTSVGEGLDHVDVAAGILADQDCEGCPLAPEARIEQLRPITL